MPSFTITAPNGKAYTIEGDNAEGAVQALHQHLATSEAPAAKPLDKYQQEAVTNRDAAAVAQDETAAKPSVVPSLGGMVRSAVGGIPVVGPAAVGGYDFVNHVTGGKANDLGRMVEKGAMMNFNDEAHAAVNTPIEMVRHGTMDASDAYKYAKAKEDLTNEDAAKNTGLMGTAAELAGGIAGGSGLAGAGLTAARATPAIARVVGARVAPWLTGAADAAAQGAIAGAGEGEGMDRVTNAEKGGAMGAVLGTALPAGLKVATAIARPLGGNAIAARLNPEAFAQGKVAEGVHNSGLSPAQIEDAISHARAEGQGEFNAADAMGDSGQRLLGASYRGSGPNGNIIEDTLRARGRDAAERMQGHIENAFDVMPGHTKEDVTHAFETAQSSRAAHEYGAVRNNANGTIDVVPAINNIDHEIGTLPGQQLTPANDTVEGILTPFRERLSRVDPNDWQAVSRIYRDMGAKERNLAATPGFGDHARLLGSARRELGDAMEAQSEGFKRANRNFAQGVRNVESVDAGAKSAQARGEVATNQYEALPTPEERYGFRQGYADRQIAKVDPKSDNANVAIPFMNNRFRKGADAMLPGDKNATLRRQIERENTMAETRTKAIGGSQTANNLAHDSDLGELTHVATGAAHGGIHGAAIAMLHAGINLSKGNTPEVKRLVAAYLLQNGNTMRPGELERVTSQIIGRMRMVQTTRDAAARRVAGSIAGVTAGRKSGR